MSDNLSENSQQVGSSGLRGKHNVINYQTRKQLIEMVVNHGSSIYRAAIDLGINHSTAKVILRKYKYNGYILKRKSQNKQKQLKSTAISKKQITKTKTQPIQVIRQKQDQPIYRNYAQPFFNGYFYLIDAYGHYFQYNPKQFLL